MVRGFNFKLILKPYLPPVWVYPAHGTSWLVFAFAFH